MKRNTSIYIILIILICIISARANTFVSNKYFAKNNHGIVDKKDKKKKKKNKKKKQKDDFDDIVTNLANEEIKDSQVDNRKKKKKNKRNKKKAKYTDTIPSKTKAELIESIGDSIPKTGYNFLSKKATNLLMEKKYEKSLAVYELLIETKRSKLTMDDIINYYYCLIQLERISEIPNPKLRRFNKNHSISEIIQIGTRKSKYADVLSNLTKKELGFKLNNNFGIRFDGLGVFYYEVEPVGNSDLDTDKNLDDLDSQKDLASKELTEKERKKLLKELAIRAKKEKRNTSKNKRQKEINIRYRRLLVDGQLETAIRVKDSIDIKGDILSQIEVGDRGMIYNIVPKDRLPERIICRGINLPKFPHNSKTYSCSMPYFNEAENRLYFCSNKTDGYGGWDIYYCDLNEDKWEDMINMGPELNTVYDEIFPMKGSANSLIFSSDGWESKGGLDNYEYDFKTQKSYNLVDFNTKGNDYSLNLHEYNELRIRAVGIKDSSLVYYYADNKISSGQNYVAKTDTVFIEKIKYVNKKTPSKKTTKRATQSENFGEKLTITRLLNLPLDTIFFNHDEYFLSPLYTEYIRKFVRAVYRKDYKKLNIFIFANSDDVGDYYYNYDMSLIRARNVERYVYNFDSGKYIKNTIMVVFGESLYLNNTFIKEGKHSYIKAGLGKSPYNTILSIRTKMYGSEERARKIFHNNPNNFKTLNKLLKDHRPPGITFVGIQALHKVKDRENLYLISLRYGVEMSIILKANLLRSYKVKPGRVLIIPYVEEDEV
ncbi:MAG: LysM peptidoglycan-binding domain-containing protein [Marinifilaceae bacterium]|jgi:outer membrane protein OmpA-like peptidoglycan-associated protein|nr:LysM peptidoglycan-binding domain-containing protein [Marinifilaceae bacterium]